MMISLPIKNASSWLKIFLAYNTIIPADCKWSHVLKIRLQIRQPDDGSLINIMRFFVRRDRADVLLLRIVQKIADIGACSDRSVIPGLAVEMILQRLGLEHEPVSGVDLISRDPDLPVGQAGKLRFGNKSRIASRKDVVTGKGA